MLTNIPPSSKLTDSLWSYVFPTIYLLTGHFLGKELHPLAGLLLAPLGLLIGWLVARRLRTGRVGAKLLAFCLPLLVLAAVVRPVAAESNVATSKALNGTWTTQKDSRQYTLRLRGDAAWLSAEPGLKNVAYQAHIQQDSLVLTASADNQLLFHISERQNGDFELDAEEGLHFTQITSQD
jgi:hypothetical protein